LYWKDVYEGFNSATFRDIPQNKCPSDKEIIIISGSEKILNEV